jgi:transposase
MPHEMSRGKPTTRRYSEAEKERAVRAVRQLRKELGTDHGTVKAGRRSARRRCRDAAQLGEAGRDRRRGEARGDVAEAERVRQLEQENRELRRANEILRRASAFFAAELDRPSK